MDCSVDWNAVAAIAQVTATFLAAGALIYTATQTKLNRKAIEAETFVQIVNTAREIGFSQGMDLIRSLPYKNYDEFKKSASSEVQIHIRKVVDFLNDLGHMIKHGYLAKEHVLRIYYLSINACEKRLLPWWLEGFRREHGHQAYYFHFESRIGMARELSA